MNQPNNAQNQSTEDPMSTLVSQVKMLDNNVSSMMNSGVKASEIIEDYICPILHAMVVAIEQGFTGLNQVAQTASIALVTSERTLAGETLNSVANNLIDVDEACLGFAESLTEDQKKDFEKIQDLISDSLEIVLAWSGDLEDQNDEDEDEDEDDASEDGESEESLNTEESASED